MLFRSDHALAGLTLVDFCFDRADVCAMPGLPIDPSPDGNRILGNAFAGNATDIFFLPNGGQDDCFARNHPRGVGGPALPACH